MLVSISFIVFSLIFTLSFVCSEYMYIHISGIPGVDGLLVGEKCPTNSRWFAPTNECVFFQLFNRFYQMEKPMLRKPYA